MKKTNTRLTALALSLALMLTSCGGGTSAATMHLRKTEGMVGVSDGEGKDVAPKENLGLYSGYQVGTQAESYAWIDLDRVKLTKMDADSEVEIVKEGKKLEIDVKSGSLFFNVTEPLDDDETMDIVTSTMMVGIRGTCGWVTEDAAALLEGTVSVTAGDQEVTVTAGEMAVLTPEGTLEVKPFTAASVPAFVREEVAEDEKLAADIQDNTGMDLTGDDPMAAYADRLAAIEKNQQILHTEFVDFEADGSPELLVVKASPDDSENSYGAVFIDVMRSGPDGCAVMMELGVGLGDLYAGMSGTFSLVESDGRMFIRKWIDDAETSRIFEDYSGSVAQSDGKKEEWGLVDKLGIVYSPFDHEYVSATWIYPHFENGLVIEDALNLDSYYGGLTEVEAVKGKYTLVRELVHFAGGGTLTVVEP